MARHPSLRGVIGQREIHHARQNIWILHFDLQFVCKGKQLIPHFTKRMNKRVLGLYVCLKVTLDFQLDWSKLRLDDDAHQYAALANCFNLRHMNLN